MTIGGEGVNIGGSVIGGKSGAFDGDTNGNTGGFVNAASARSTMSSLSMYSLRRNSFSQLTSALPTPISLLQASYITSKSFLQHVVQQGQSTSSQLADNAVTGLLHNGTVPSKLL